MRYSLNDHSCAGLIYTSFFKFNLSDQSDHLESLQILNIYSAVVDTTCVRFFLFRCRFEADWEEPDF